MVPLSLCQFERTLLCTCTLFVNGCHIRKLCVSLRLCVDSRFMCGQLHRKCINQSDLCGQITGSALTNQICVGK